MQETSVTTCPRHPSVETALRCASCGELICPQCMVITPVGAKCRNCGTDKGNRLFSFTPSQMAAAAGVGLLMGAFAGWAVEFRIGIFFSLFLAFAYGRFAGDMVMRAAGRKRGARMELLAGVALVLGVVFGRLVSAALVFAAVGHAVPAAALLRTLVALVQPTPIPLILLVIVVASAVSRIRYA